MHQIDLLKLVQCCIGGLGMATGKKWVDVKRGTVFELWSNVVDDIGDGLRTTGSGETEGLFWLVCGNHRSEEA